MGTDRRLRRGTYDQNKPHAGKFGDGASPAPGRLVSAGVIAFELVEWLTIGFQPLEAVVGLLAVLMFVLAWRLPPSHRPALTGLADTDQA